MLKEKNCPLPLQETKLSFKNKEKKTFLDEGKLKDVIKNKYKVIIFSLYSSMNCFVYPRYYRQQNARVGET